MIFSEDPPIAVEMEPDYLKEMIFDWISANFTIRGYTSIDINHYAENKDKIIMHPNTRNLLEKFIYGDYQQLKEKINQNLLVRPDDYKKMFNF